MKHTVEHIRLLLDNKMELMPKCLGVELVELGFLKYKKLSPKNYYYWWYEVPDGSKIDEKKFTYQWEDMEKTEKCDWFIKLIDYHEDWESIYNLIVPILNLEAAKNEIDIKTKKKQTDKLLEMYYGNKKKKPLQQQLLFHG